MTDQTQHRPRGDAGRFGPRPVEVAQKQALGWLERLHQVEQELEVATARAVREARRHGASWHAVGRALGVSKQAAQQRYGETDGYPEDRHRSAVAGAEPTGEVCWCGLRARGDVQADDVAPEHYCRQCSARHCQMRAYFEGSAARVEIEWSGTLAR